jgi:1-acyl-sn-glycerol-3-phosphate acyltransferase
MRRLIRILYHTIACWGLFTLPNGLYMFAAPLLWVIFKVGGLSETRPAFQTITFRFNRWYIGAAMQIVTPLRFVFIPPKIPVRTEGPAVFMGNHSSVTDLLLTMSSIGRCSIVGKRGMAYIPLYGLTLMLMGMIFVDRRRKFESQDVFAAFRERLRLGECILTFPQGSRTLPWSRRTVKRGLFKLVMEEKVPIVPVAITGTKYTVKKGQVLFDIGRPLKVMVHFLPPVLPEGDPESLSDVTALRDRIVESIGSILEAERDLTREGHPRPSGTPGSPGL